MFMYIHKLFTVVNLMNYNQVSLGYLTCKLYLISRNKLSLSL